MSTVQIKTPEGSASGSVELPDHVFDVTANIALMHQVVTAQLNAARQGTHDVKGRGEVRGGEDLLVLLGDQTDAGSSVEGAQGGVATVLDLLQGFTAVLGHGATSGSGGFGAQLFSTVKAPVAVATGRSKSSS